MTTQLNTNIILAAVAGVALVVIAIVLARFKARRKIGQYKRAKFITENEREFFSRLTRALPEYYIFPQVSMLALLEASSRNEKRAYTDRLRIAQQRVDYVIADRRCEIIAVIELDDKTHSAAKDKVRDGRLQQGGIRTIRFESRNKPSLDAIRAAVLSARAAA